VRFHETLYAVYGDVDDADDAIALTIGSAQSWDRAAERLMKTPSEDVS